MRVFSYVSRFRRCPELKKVVENPFGGPDATLIPDSGIVGRSECVNFHLRPVRAEMQVEKSEVSDKQSVG